MHPIQLSDHSRQRHRLPRRDGRIRRAARAVPARFPRVLVLLAPPDAAARAAGLSRVGAGSARLWRQFAPRGRCGLRVGKPRGGCGRLDRGIGREGRRARGTRLGRGHCVVLRHVRPAADFEAHHHECSAPRFDGEGAAHPPATGEVLVYIFLPAALDSGMGTRAQRLRGDRARVSRHGRRQVPLSRRGVARTTGKPRPRPARSRRC